MLDLEPQSQQRELLPYVQTQHMEFRCHTFPWNVMIYSSLLTLFKQRLWPFYFATYKLHFGNSPAQVSGWFTHTQTREKDPNIAHTRFSDLAFLKVSNKSPLQRARFPLEHAKNISLLVSLMLTLAHQCCKHGHPPRSLRFHHQKQRRAPGLRQHGVRAWTAVSPL